MSLALGSRLWPSKKDISEAMGNFIKDEFKQKEVISALMPSSGGILDLEI